MTDSGDQMAVFRSVFHSLQSVLNTLRMPQYSKVKEVCELITIAESHHVTDKVQKSDTTHPFIVIEGMDATGKTTVSTELSKQFGAALKTTPPEYFLDLRPYFDKQPETLRRAYYSLGNYVTAHDVAATLAHSPVVMDRFWHSTAAYGIANEINEMKDLKLPAADSCIYQWPADLLKPDIVFLLTVSEAVRTQRHASRNTTNTNEEQLLNEKSDFRDTLREAYHHMRDPPMHVISTDEPVGEIVKKIKMEVNRLCQEDKHL